MSTDEHQEKNSANEYVDSPWDLNEGDKFQYQEQLFKIIRKRSKKMTIKRLSDKKKVTLRRN